MEWEKAQGLVDMSDSCFEEAAEHDTGIVAQFLNSSLLAAFGHKTEAHDSPPADPNLAACRVAVPGGQGGRRLLRDALLQWRLRHTAHPVPEPQQRLKRFALDQFITSICLTALLSADKTSRAAYGRCSDPGLRPVGGSQR